MRADREAPMIRFHLLGSLQLRAADGRELRSVLAQPKRVALLAYLAAATPRGFHRRDSLVGLLWPDLDQEHARGALNQAVYQLRRSLGHGVILSRGNEEIGVDAAALKCDVSEFELALAAGTLRDALQVYRGDLLVGFFLPGAPEWERWLEAERSRLRDRAAKAAWTLAEKAAADQRASDTAHWGRHALTLAPGDETRLRNLVSLLHGLGDRAGAMRAYDEAVERLARDYEIEPSAETRALIEALRLGHPAATGAGSTDLGLSPPGAASASSAQRPAARDRSGDGREPGSVGPGSVRAGPRHRSPLPRRLRLLLAGVTVVALTVFGALLRLPAGTTGGASPDPASADLLHDRSRIAVLPLADLSPDPSDAYFADGLTEELISRLSVLGGFRVIARTSVLPYREGRRSVTEIGRDLEVDAFLEGSVRREGRRVRISVRLVHAGSLEHLWTQAYDAELAEVLPVQGEIAEKVAEALAVHIPAGERTRLAMDGTASPEAYSAYLKGRHLLGKLDEASFREALSQFQRALDLDPAFAHAWSGLASAYTQLSTLTVLAGAEAYPRARAAAQRGLELNPDLAEAHAALGMVETMYDWDTEGGERHFRRALELDPSSAAARRQYSVHLRNLGRFDEALDQVRLAQELDPLAVFPRIEEGLIHFLAGRSEEAIATYRAVLDVAPDQTHAYAFIALVKRTQGEIDAALSALEQADPDGDRPYAQAIRGYLHARAGRDDEARRFLVALDELSAHEPVTAFHRAVIHLGLGEHERALDLLEEAVDQPSWHLRLLKVEPVFDPLRGEARFQALLERVGLAS